MMPPNSSALYAITSAGPTIMNGSSTQPTLATPATPNATAPASPATVTATSVGAGMRVCNGRPFSSSSACAASPTARKNAVSVASSGVRLTWGARLAPMTT